MSPHVPNFIRNQLSQTVQLEVTSIQMSLYSERKLQKENGGVYGSKERVVRSRPIYYDRLTLLEVAHNIYPSPILIRILSFLLVST